MLLRSDTIKPDCDIFFDKLLILGFNFLVYCGIIHRVNLSCLIHLGKLIEYFVVTEQRRWIFQLAALASWTIVHFSVALPYL